ncbi:hypothetical protein ACFYM0_03145 [Streptomyces sp. NPDC006487]
MIGPAEWGQTIRIPARTWPVDPYWLPLAEMEKAKLAEMLEACPS